MEPSHVQLEHSVPGGPSHLRLGEILIRRGHIDQDDLALALSQQDVDDHDLPLGRLLVTLGAIDDETLTRALSEQSGFPVVELEGFTPDAEIVGRLTREIALQFEMLPLELRDGVIIVAVAAPPSRDLRREISRRLHSRLQVVLATPAALRDAIERAFPVGEVSPSASESGPLDLIPSTGVRYEPDAAERMMRVVARDASPSTSTFEPSPEVPDRVLEWLVDAAIELGAHSLHLLAQPGGVLVRARVGRDMRDLVELPERAGSMLVARLWRSFGLSTDTGEVQRGTSSSGLPGFGPLLALEAAPTAQGLSVLIRPLETRASDHEPPGLDVIRRHLAEVVAGRCHGLAVLLCPDPEQRQATLCRLAVDPMMRERNVATIDVGCEAAAPRVSQLSSPLHGGQANAIRSSRTLDHDVVLVDAGHGDDEALRAVVDAGMDDVAVIVGIGGDASAAIAALCASAPPPLLASAIAIVIGLDVTGVTSVVTLSDELRELLLDGDGAQQLIDAIEAGATDGDSP